MSQVIQQSPLEQRLSLLNEREKRAYEKYLSENKPPLSPRTSGDFFMLFLNGSSCEEISRLNPSFGLGIIVKARIDFDWDGQRDDYLRGLYTNIKEKVQKIQLEAIEHAANSISVYHAMLNDRYKKYLQTRDEKDLGDFKNISFKQYKEQVELMLKLTGQESTKKQEINHTHTLTQPVVQSVNATEIIDKNRTLTSEDAASILKALESGE